ncbi:MAG: hypothetical protein KDC71_14845, partial [Acidobacteria bacterium]|nr:hypothetical protein [Acidobacteriota bacterium]
MSLFPLLLLAITLISAVLILGNWRWQHKTKARLLRFDLKPKAVRNGHESIPHCVNRYLESVMPQEAHFESVILTHRGFFNMAEKGQNWKAFRSQQWVAPNAYQFLWDGRIQILPGLTVQVHDGLIGELGILQAQLAGWIPLAYQNDRATLAQGELLRFLAESVWYPWMLKPENGVSWQAIGENKAEASICLGSNRVSLVFEFGDDGKVLSVFCHDRPRLVAGKPQPTPWFGRFWDYREFNGFCLPHAGEVAWVIDGQEHPYWRGTLETVEYAQSAERQVGFGVKKASSIHHAFGHDHEAHHP